MAWTTTSDGPYGFSLFASLARVSYSSGARWSRGRAGGVPCASRSSGEVTPMAPNAEATPPTKVRRETAECVLIRMSSLWAFTASCLLLPASSPSSCPAQIVLRKWQRPDPLAGRNINRVRERRDNRRQRRLAKARGRVVRQLPVDFDRRRLHKAQQREVPEVVLHHPSVL